ncbi:MAG: 1-acyl-sn-glycerol-3-phosphate acyltransferase [Flavobacteriales bacterium]|nr:MAG: 1-acyl-sn-glycerol-3-phosphate acyltransferase [Flavobacteriales bacterium]
MFKKDTFGQSIILKKLIIRVFGIITYVRFNIINVPVINGAEIIKDLPKEKILFISNHQTYFADAAFLFHVIHSSLDNYPNRVKLRSILKCMKTNLFFVAAEETMKSGILPKILGFAGAISIKRTWREAGKDIKRQVSRKDTENIEKALNSGWVITFPQGTTRAFADGRKGTAHIIKNYEPLVVPIVINGFRRAFDKKGLFMKVKGTQLQVTIKQPLDLDYNDNIDNILHKVMDSIEQSKKFEWRAKN